MKLERITEQQIRDAISKLQPDKCQYDYESVANCQRDADQKVVDELEFFIEQLKATNGTLIQQTAEYGREYLKAEAKVKTLEAKLPTPKEAIHVLKKIDAPWLHDTNHSCPECLILKPLVAKLRAIIGGKVPCKKIIKSS